MRDENKFEHIIVCDEPLPAAERAWIEEVAALSASFSAADGEGDGEGDALDSFFLQSAGDLLWSRSGGKPCWSRLDVEAYLTAHRETSREQEALAAVTLIEFYAFLGDRGKLAYRDTVAMLQRLEAHAAESLRAVGYEPRYGRNRSERRARRSSRWLN